jgi:putative hydrolase of the HAD superfamily
MPLRALLLDVGNTLLTEAPSRFAIYAEVALARGVVTDEAAMRSSMSRAHRELPRVVDGGYRYSDPWFRAFIRRIFGAELGLPEGTVLEVTEELFERFESAGTFRVLPGARELLGRARRAGLAVGVVSNWSARLPRVLAAVDLAACLDFVICSALEGAEKPEPAIFRAALARARVRPEEALHAGDDWQLDVEGARGVGIQAVLVDHAGRAPLAHEAGVPRVRTLDELASLILERAA